MTPTAIVVSEQRWRTSLDVLSCAKALRDHERAAVARADSYEHSARQIDAQAQIDTLKTMELEQALDAALEKAER